MNIYLHPSAVNMPTLDWLSEAHGLEAIIQPNCIKLEKERPALSPSNLNRLKEYQHKRATRLRNKNAQFQVEIL